jgi:hypothetical protein
VAAALESLEARASLTAAFPEKTHLMYGMMTEFALVASN